MAIVLMTAHLFWSTTLLVLSVVPQDQLQIQLLMTHADVKNTECVHIEMSAALPKCQD